jgi:hypothetical protein
MQLRPLWTAAFTVVLLPFTLAFARLDTYYQLHTLENTNTRARNKHAGTYSKVLLFPFLKRSAFMESLTE